MTDLERAQLNITVPVTFRIATKQDLPKLEWYGQYTHYRNLFQRAFREQLAGRRTMLIADSRNFPIGCVFIQFIKPDLEAGDEDSRGYLYSLRVMEMFRGSGIGTRLISEAEEIIRTRGCRWSMLSVAKENRNARRLYERLGYEIVTDDPGIWSYVDHRGQTRHINEPCWILQKEMTLR